MKSNVYILGAAFVTDVRCGKTGNRFLEIGPRDKLADDTISITSRRTYEPGEFIKIEKGRRTTSDYMMHIGYLTDLSVEDDVCRIRFGKPLKRFKFSLF